MTSNKSVLDDQQASPPSKAKRLFQLISIALLLVISLGSWAFASPIGSSPDDGFHLTSIWCSNGGYQGMCEPDVSPSSRLVAPALIDSPTCFAYQKQISAKCQIDSGVLTNYGLSSVTHGNYSGGGYPPIYYATMHLFASPDVVVSALIMRFVNIFIFVALAISLWLIAPFRTRTAQKMTWAATLIPLGIFLIGSNNPSSWAIIGIGFSVLSLFAFLDNRLTKNQTIWIALIYLIAVLISAGSRGDSAAYGVVVVVTVLIATYRSWRDSLLKLMLPLSGLIISAAFYLCSGHAGVTTNGLGEAGSTEEVSAAALLVKNVVSIPNLIVGTFTGEGWGLGWLDTPMPEIVWVTALAVCFSIVVISIQRLNLFSAASLLIAAVALIGVPLYILQTSKMQVGEFVQPRYIYPLIILITALAILVTQNEPQFGSRAWRLLSFIGLSAAYAAALYVNLDRYIHGLGHPLGYNLNANIEWWWSNFPIQPMYLLALGSIATIALLYIVFEPFSRNSSQNELVGIGKDSTQTLVL